MYDNIPVKILQNLKVKISILLTRIFNLIIRTETIEKWLFRILKSGDNHLYENYRSIAILSNMSKIIEKLFK